MSASSVPLPFLVPKTSASPTGNTPMQAGPRLASSKIVRRRPNMQQGRALEILGHAIEYLVDSRMFLVNAPHTPAEAAAIQILSRSSREVFASCAEVVPLNQRLKLWAIDRLRGGSLHPQGHAPGPRA